MVMVMIAVDMMPVVVVGPAVVVMPPMGPVVPIPRRIIASPIGRPEPIVNNGSVDIHRLHHIVCTIDILIADNLRSYLTRHRILLYVNRCNILINILRKNSLKDNKMLVAFGRFNHAKVIYLAVSVQVEIGDMRLFAVQVLLKDFQIF